MSIKISGFTDNIEEVEIDGKVITKKGILDLIEENEGGRGKKLRRYHKGYTDKLSINKKIYSRLMNGVSISEKVNYIQTIVDYKLGEMQGKTPKLNYAGEVDLYDIDAEDLLKKELEKAYLKEVYSELSFDMVLFGEASLLVAVDENKDLQLISIKPYEVIFVENRFNRRKKDITLRYYYLVEKDVRGREKEVLKIELYSKDMIYFLECKDGKRLMVDYSVNSEGYINHPFNGVPLIQMKPSRDSLPFLDKVINEMINLLEYKAIEKEIVLRNKDSLLLARGFNLSSLTNDIAGDDVPEDILDVLESSAPIFENKEQTIQEEILEREGEIQESFQEKIDNGLIITDNEKAEIININGTDLDLEELGRRIQEKENEIYHLSYIPNPISYERHSGNQSEAVQERKNAPLEREISRYEQAICIGLEKAIGVAESLIKNKLVASGTDIKNLDFEVSDFSMTVKSDYPRLGSKQDVEKLLDYKDLGISNRTILSMVPFVEDVDEEIRRIIREEEELNLTAGEYLPKGEKSQMEENRSPAIEDTREGSELLRALEELKEMEG